MCHDQMVIGTTQRATVRMRQFAQCGQLIPQRLKRLKAFIKLVTVSIYSDSISGLLFVPSYQVILHAGILPRRGKPKRIVDACG